MKFPFKVVTPYGVKYDGEVDEIEIRTTAGQICVLPHHIPLVSEVMISILKIHNDNNVLECAISDGILYVKESETTLIVNSLEKKNEIDFERARESKERAENRLKNKENIDIKRAELSLARALNRLSLNK